MVLYKWVREYLEKYSFVKRVKLQNAYVYIYYEVDGEKAWKRIPYRATRDKLMRTIESIKEDINYYEDLKRRKEEGQYDIDKDKPVIFTNR